jgi:iron-sulfur cluster repair protein YtfE (RIC family)
MNVHQLFLSEHTALRQHIADVQKALKSSPASVEELYPRLQEALRNHLRKEDTVYYAEIDGNKQFADRVLMHDLRNDHAAVVFTLESLAIKLRKKVPMEEWRPRFENMIKVLIAHFEQEEKTLFPFVEKNLKPAELQSILEKVQALE